MNLRLNALRVVAFARPEDYIRGTPGNDLLIGTDGDDTLNGRAGVDTMVGGDGNDTYMVTRGDVVQEEGSSGIDTVIASARTYTLTAGVENLTLTNSGGTGTGNALDNTIIATAGSNYLYGGDGNDHIEGIGQLFGEGGDDVLYAYSHTDAYGGTGDDEIHVVGGALGYASGDEGNDTLIGADDLYQATLSGGDGNDLLVMGQSTSTRAIGGNGEDTIIGGISADVYLHGGAGADSVAGAAGDDVLYDDYFSDPAPDTLDGGSGIDVVIGNWESSTEAIVWINDPTQVAVVYGNTITGIESLQLNLGSGNDIISNMNGAGGDTIYAGDGNDSIVGGGNSADPYAPNQVVGQNGNDTLVGATSMSNVLFGQDGNDSLVGGERADELHGESGADVLLGNGGDDRFGGGSFDTLSGGEGVDLLELSLSLGSTVLNWANDPNATQLVATNTVSGIERLQIYCGSGDDFVSNLLVTADDTFSGNSGSDRFLAGAGYDHLTGGDGNDTLNGGTGTDNLTGDAGADRLIGGADDDTLTGGGDNDVLTGGKGSDHFVYATPTGFDVVADFATGVDTAQLSGYYLSIGDRDSTIDRAMTIAGPGGFAAQNELVVVTADIAGQLSLAAAAAAIGSANNAFKAGQTAVFVVDNGTDSAVCLFTSSGADAAVSASELTLVTLLQGTASTVVTDYSFES